MSSFQIDPKIQQVAEAYCQDAVELAKNNFGVALDGSEDSVREVERLLDRLSNTLPIEKPDEATIWLFSKAFGSYVGEMMRTHHGGSWGMMSLGDETFPAVLLPGGMCCWPWARVHNRLLNGYEDNVWHYYCVMLEKAEAVLEKAEAD